ncbi:MAG: hypothetical protein E6R03_04965 [Hyphomicrobiaceae bacterium]|nr:MAG: hypothetical protein E6R03_04965 [Hyphomicrobiaceae bacterium]
MATDLFEQHGLVQQPNQNDLFEQSGVSAPEKGFKPYVHAASGGLLRGMLNFNPAEIAYDVVNHSPQIVNLFPGEQGMGTIDEMAAKAEPNLFNNTIKSVFQTKDPSVALVEQLPGMQGLSQKDTNYPRTDAVMEAVGSTLAPSGFLASKAKAAEQAGAPIANKFMQWMTKPYMGRAGAQVAQDISSAAGAGLATELARESDLGPVATLFAGLAGGTASNFAHGGIEGVVRDLYANRKVNLPNGVVAKASTIDNVKNEMEKRVVDKNATIKNIDDTLAMTSEMGLPDPTLGTASGDIGLNYLENVRRAKDPVLFQVRDQELRSGLSNKLGDLSNPNADVTAPQRAAQQYIDDTLKTQQTGIDDLYQQQSGLEQAKTGLEQQAQDIVAPIAARRGAEGRASRVMNEQIGTEGALGTITKQKNQMFDDAAQGAYVDAPSLAKLVDEVNAEAPKLAPDARLPDYIMNGINKFIAPKGTLEGPGSTANKIPAEEVIKLRMYLDSEIKSLRAQGKYTPADTLRSFKKKINQTFELDPQFAEANTFYKQEYAPRFRTPYGEKFRDLVHRGTGVGTDDADKVAGIFLNGTKAAKDDLNKIREIVPDQKAFDGAEEMYFDAMLAKKDLNPANVRKYLADNQDILPPHLKDKYQTLVQEMMGNKTAMDGNLQKITDLKKSIRDAEGTMRGTERSLNSGVFGKMAKHDTERYAESILSQPDAVTQAKAVKDQFKGNKEALDGIEEAFVQNLVRKATGKQSAHASATGAVDDMSRPVSFNSLTKELDDHREVLSVFMSPEKMNTLTRMQRVMSRLGNLQRRATSGSDTFEKLSSSQQDAIDLIGAAVNLKYGLVGGGMINRVVRESAKLMFSNKYKIDAENLLTQAALNPKVAKAILEATPRTVENGRLFNELSALIAVDKSMEASEREPLRITVRPSDKNKK